MNLYNFIIANLETEEARNAWYCLTHKWGIIFAGAWLSDPESEWNGFLTEC